MIRTTIMLPEGLKRQAATEARQLQISFADFVRQAITEKLPPLAKGGDRLKRRRQDPLFRLLVHLPLVKCSTATDVAASHDEYLYGAKSGHKMR